MKKVLILAYDFPPYVSVGGLRPLSWVKYFKEYNIEPILVTRQWSNDNANYLDYISPSKSPNLVIEDSESSTILRTPYTPSLANKILLNYGENRFRIFRKAYSAILEISEYFLPIGTKKNIYKYADEYLKNNKVDMILATADPYVLFHYANKLSKKYKTPWIADYRDPWSQNEKITKFFPFNKLYPYLEKKIVSNAILITTPSNFFKSQISSLLSKSKIEIIYNGFDPKILNSSNQVIQNKAVLSIGYVGTLYAWHPIESFFKVCLELKEEADSDIEVNLYGINNEFELQNLIDTKFINIKDNIVIHPKVNNEKLFSLLAKNNLLLLFNYYSFVGTKIYDYITINRKILFCYKNDKEALMLKDKYYEYNDSNYNKAFDQEEILLETNSGLIINNQLELKETLTHLLKEHKETGVISCNSRNVENYSRKIQVKRLSELIYSLT